MKYTVLAWTAIPSLIHDEDAQAARHNLLATLPEAGTNRQRKSVFALTAIVIAEGCGKAPLTTLEHAKRKFRALALRQLLDRQAQAYRRARTFDHAADSAKLGEASKQQLRAKRDEQFEIHDAAVDEIARRIANAGKVVWQKSPGGSIRPCGKAVRS